MYDVFNEVGSCVYLNSRSRSETSYNLVRLNVVLITLDLEIGIGVHLQNNIGPISWVVLRGSILTTRGH